MNLMPLITAGLETALNRILYRDRGLKPARQRLNGKVLTLRLTEFSYPLVLVFSEQQLDVLSDWQDSSDCTVITSLKTLTKLRDRQQLTPLIRSGELQVDGDLQVVQQFSALMDLAELDPAEYLAPWVGDIAAQGISQRSQQAFRFFTGEVQRRQDYLGQAITEEWRVAPGSLELAWFSEEVDAMERSLEALDARLAQLEAK
ncbi:ubiquinone biosynthesis protein UbiJ [Pantoea eucalypti]|jgi:ubiquinone biosynthesis protein UbiJ|uniref:Ubiquinone biosynthesis accessory factor UbiJ n=2 Tax=Pantoea eucalypti TaxID=470933 RepID=A0ABY2ZK20_9GAMM|nr:MULTISPECIES: SCP2 domain-containing protein [Pantoea]PQL26798.1 SCP2 domain-containing protein [Pantoea ananatis]QXG54470.1 SCP2 domain-containing protein [Pantoea jilinensis]TPD91378.1 SCP2 domain-containing protein [Pantoea vagans]EFM18836.1 Sterol-binding domain protein [Pantoea sp. aB]MBD9554676.1 SCP2 domain-containing protein [Pantoea sp. PNT01]